MRTFLDQPPTSRTTRSPKHTFRCDSMAFVAQPFYFSRVLPGETMTSLFMESRVVTDPVLSSIIGWKKEYYYFYVKVTDLLTDAIRDMFVDPTNTDLRATLGIAANDQQFYTGKQGVDYMKRAYQRVITEWFRDDGETHANNTLAGDARCIVQIRENTFLDSLTDTDDMPEGAAISGATDAGDLERLMDAFENLRALGLASMTYEDFLRSYGISIPDKDLDKPELLHRFSDFSYPANTINPANGAPTSAISWVFKNGSNKTDKPKFFKEPGFIIGISIARPKVYFSGLAGSAAAHATRAWDWLPNYMRDMPETRLKYFDVGGGVFGPLGDRTTDVDEYWLDMADELLHGDQYQNVVAFNIVPATTGSSHLLALPTGTSPVNWKYPTEAMCKSFFTDAAGTAWLIHQDGYVSTSIKGREVDYTQAHVAQV